MQGTMWLFPNSREWRIGIRESGAVSRKQEAGSRKPKADSGQRIIYPHTSSYSNSDTLRLRFPATRAYCPGTSGWSS